MHDLFVKMQNPDHCLYQLLPPERSTTNSLRERGHSFELYEYNYKFFRQGSFVVNCLLCDVFFNFSYHYKLPFDVYAYTLDMCTNKVYLLTYLLIYGLWGTKRTISAIAELLTFHGFIVPVSEIQTLYCYYGYCFVFFLLFPFIPLSHKNLLSLLLPGNKRDQSVTSTRCAKLSQFVVEYYLSNLTHFTGFRVTEDFSQRPTIHYCSNIIAASTNLFIGLWLLGDDVITLQPIRCCSRATIRFLEREISATLADSITA